MADGTSRLRSATSFRIIRLSCYRYFLQVGYLHSRTIYYTDPETAILQEHTVEISKQDRKTYWAKLQSCLVSS
jgi:hypothetical protein